MNSHFKVCFAGRLLRRDSRGSLHFVWQFRSTINSLVDTPWPKMCRQTFPNWKNLNIAEEKWNNRWHNLPVEEKRAQPETPTLPPTPTAFEAWSRGFSYCTLFRRKSKWGPHTHSQSTSHSCTSSASYHTRIYSYKHGGTWALDVGPWSHTWWWQVGTSCVRTPLVVFIEGF